MRQHLVPTLVVTAMIVGAFQLVRPAMTNPPIDRTRTLQASAAAVHPAVPVIERACQDCHSNKTEWPWYSKVAPASWLIAQHVAEGRSAVNFSDWSSYSDEQQRKILKSACEEVADRDMPVRAYGWIHPETRLTAGDVRVICDLAHTYTVPAPDVEVEPIAFRIR